MHAVFSIVAPVASERVDEVRRLLDLRPTLDDRAQAHYPGGFPLPLVITPDLLPMLHFASMVVFESQPLGGAQRSMGHLVLECCVDGPAKDFLCALVDLDRKTGDRLAAVFACCHGYAAAADLRAFLERHVCSPDLFHIGVPWMRRDHIHCARDLREALDSRLDDLVRKGRGGDDPEQIVNELRVDLGVPSAPNPSLHFTRNGWTADPEVRWRSRAQHWAKFLAAGAIGGTILLGLVWLGWRLDRLRGVAIATALIALVASALVRWLHGHDRSRITRNPDHLARVKEREDFEVQNHMCTWTLIQPSPFRLLAARLILRALNLAYRTLFTDVTPGRLQGLPTIHFAHWTLVPVAGPGGTPSGRYALMFLSNYDGSWEAYLDDFIAFLFQGVAAIWANCEGFRWPSDSATFKAYARNGMTPWQCWYVAEPGLTVLNIHNNDQIRRGLLAPSLAREDARLWLTRLGARKDGTEVIPQQPVLVQETDVQGTVLTGYRHLKLSSFVPLRITHPAEASAWFKGAVVPRVTDGRAVPDEHRRGQSAVNVAFTCHGLAALGLPGSVCDGFSLAFREGIAPAAHAHRSRALGDVADSAPQWWRWGGPHQPVDVLLMLYAADKDTLKTLEEDLVDTFIPACGVRVGDNQICGDFLAPPGPLRNPAEHFGFADGISQPDIEGTWHTERTRKDSDDPIKAGEFLLGYVDEAGAIAPGVPVPAHDDRHRLLPPLSPGARTRDFGRNGSYLVARQLRQHVSEFRRYVEDAAGTGAGDLHVPRQLAARLVGRTQEGVPLATIEPGQPNRFDFADDPHGFVCPIGSHIRRANPRASLGDDPAAAQTRLRRRRLLRRGRTYGDPVAPGASDEGTRGIMFLCLNSDIERQFEFVQQNWINHPSFDRLYAERDGVIADPRSLGTLLTVQRDGVRERLAGLDRFVTVVGGEYFFLPGMSALRYLADRVPEAMTQVSARFERPVADAAVPPVVRVPRAAAALVALARVLPVLSLVWALRFPLLLAAALVSAPLAAAGPQNTMGASFFLTTRWGLVLVAALASLAASVVMITARLVLLYGDRVDLPGARWRGPTRWAHVWAFQVLALPVVTACVHWTAVDAAWTMGLAANTGVYTREALRLVPAALAGFGAGLLFLQIATMVQALRPGSRPDLIFPVSALTLWVGPGTPRLHTGVVARLQSRLAQWLVDHVPPSMGASYIDYRERRLLPGHASAAALAAVFIGVYAAGYVALSPAWSSLAGRVPSIAFVLLLLIVLAWLASSVSFFLDRYRVSTLLVVAAWLVLIAIVFRTDHYFHVGDPLPPAPAAREALARADAGGAPGAPIVVVMSEGLGLASSAWTAEVLTGLAADPSAGSAFTRSLRLLSASSGASVGTMFFVNGYGPGGFRVGDLGGIRRQASGASSSQGGWGVVYPDLMRTVTPFLVPTLVDRGWAMEQMWAQRVDGPAPMLSGWRNDVAAGWRPATAFGVTIVERGEHALFATFRNRLPEPADGRDISMITAARLSATFPFISPAARPDIESERDHPAYHLLDSGVTDNSGWTAVREWLDAVRGDVGCRRVVLVDIRSIPSSKPGVRAPINEAWTLELTGALRALLESRNARHARVGDDMAEFDVGWRRDHRPIERVVFSLDDATVPLTWNLGHADEVRLAAAWGRNRPSVDRVRALLTGDQACTP